MKLFTPSNKKRRFQIYDAFGNLSEPEKAGIIHNKEELDLGTPNLSRSENVTIFGSNSSTKETLAVKLKWRPMGDSGNLVTLISRLHFSTFDEKCYESEEIETYEPQQVLMHSRESGDSMRVLQFGSRANKMRLYVSSPYRRARLVFIGQVRNKQDNSTAFLRLTCIIVPTAQVFDFLDQYDEQCARQVYNSKKDPKPLRSFADTVSTLLLHDRHEQKIRMTGQYLLILDNDSKERIKRGILLWGFHCRHFITTNGNAPRSIRTKRIYAYMINGQAYALGNNKLDSDDIDFGYVSFKNLPLTRAISKPVLGIDWNEQITERLDKFELEVSGQEQTFCSKTISKRAINYKPGEDKFLWFELNTNDSPGYAFVTLDDELTETQEELEAIEKNRDARELAADANQVASLRVSARSTDNLESGTQESPLILSLGDEQCRRSDLVGAKASSLAHLIKLQQLAESKPNLNMIKFKVPFGFSTTKRVYELVLGENIELSKKIKHLEQQVGEGHLDNLPEQCNALVAYVEQLKAPELLREQLQSKLDSHYKDHQGALLFAVRSSSWGEDEEDMSAAGQLKTILNVGRDSDSLYAAVMSCFASKFSPENIEYKRQHGLPLDMPMSVVIQEMIECDKAGVMFTCDPTNGDPSVTTITANYGLGESVVSAQADPDSIRARVLSNDSASIDSVCPQDLEVKIELITIGKKNVIIGNSGTNDANIDKSKCCLSDDEIIQLTKCAQQVRKYFYSQQRDIEFGLWRENSNEPASAENSQTTIYLFQSRPVTGLETPTNEEFLDECSKPSQAEVPFFTRANIGEVMPYAVSPLALTCNVHCWSALGARMFIRLTGREEDHVPQCTADVFYEKYHSFFNLRCSVIISLSSASRSLLARSMEIGLFGREMGPQPEILEASKGFSPPEPMFEGPKFNWLFRSIIWTPLRECAKQRALMERLRREVEEETHIVSAPGDPKRPLELFEQLGRVMNFLEEAWLNHIANITFGSKQNVALTAFLSKYIKDPMQLTAASNKFLAISPNVISAEIPERIERMAGQIEAKGQEELQRFLALSDSEALEYCQKGKSSNEELSRSFAEFIKRFGHRCYNEFELSAKSWREEPQKIVDMIRLNCSSKLAPSTTSDESKTPNGHGQLTKRPKTNEEVIGSIPELKQLSLADRIKLKYSLAPRSQLLLSVREQTKDILVLHADIVRDIARRLAKELQLQLRIPDSELMYYLLYDELQQLVFDHQPALVMAATRRRQMFRQLFGETVWKFDEIFSDITPNHLKEEEQDKNKLTESENSNKLQGTPASSGRVRGRVCLVEGYKELHKVRPGTILLTHSTDIAFSPVFPLISGIITEVGGLISHGAVVAREYGLPSVIGIPNVTKILQDNEEIILDAENGIIVRLSGQQDD